MHVSVCKHAILTTILSMYRKLNRRLAMYVLLLPDLWCIHFIMLVWTYTTIVISVQYCSFYLLVFGFTSSVFVIYQSCSLSYRDVGYNAQSKYSTAIVSLHFSEFFHQNLQGQLMVHTGQAGILMEDIQFVIPSCFSVCLCVS